MNENIGDTTMYIRAVQAANVYMDNNNLKRYKKVTEGSGENKVVKYEPIKDDNKIYYSKAVISDSIFTRYAVKHGVTLTKRNRTLDFVMIKFDYGYIGKKESECIKAEELRTLYYENGISVTWKEYDKDGKKIEGKRQTINYKMLYRTTGKAKQGDCVFCRADLHNVMLKYMTMDLFDKIPDVQGAKIVELSAYAPLITATAKKYIHIPLDNIFVVKDESVSCYKNAHIVKYKKYKEKNKNGEEEYKEECYVKRNVKDTPITNTIWDGMGIISEELFPNNMEGFIYCRSHFFKSCLFRGDIQQYFKDYYKDDYDTAYSIDMFGRKLKVSDIKVIVSDNSLKWLKFTEVMSKAGTNEKAFEYYKKVIKKDGEIFEIVKDAHASKYGEWQRMSFQMNNTLLTTDENTLTRIAQPSIDYYNELKLNTDSFVDFLAVTSPNMCSINNILIDMYRANPDVERWSYFKNKRTKILSEYKLNRLQQGKLLQRGDNLTICGNVIALLKKVTGQKDFLNEGCFEVMNNAIQCYTTQFGEGEYIAGFRNPHNSPNNIVNLYNVYPTELIKYFPKLGKNVVVINGIYTDVQERLNSQDLDSDTIYATNQADIVELAKKAYVEYPTIVNGIGKKPNSYNKSMKAYALMDNNISASQTDVGESSNLAQRALSYWFDNGCKNEELEDIFIICAVLAQVAIDSAKRTFEATPSKEINRLIRKDCMKKPYPKFYAEIQKYKNKKKKNYKEIEKRYSGDNVESLNCPMDIIFDIIEENAIDLRKDKSLNTKTNKRDADYLDFTYDKNKVNRSQLDKITSIISEYNQAIEDINKKELNEDNFNESEKLIAHNECVNKLKNLTIKNDTFKMLISKAFNDNKYAPLRDSILIMLYDTRKDDFMSYVKKLQKR